uniref:28S ribosomal protein S35, mitochondrial n=1 Tax=Esox lucius TaxID=8010 RepID=A0A6Q2X1Y5_ESOLU
MAAHTLNIYMLSLGRMHCHIYGRNVHKALNRATYATALSTNNSSPNKGFPDRGSRGPIIRRPRREEGEPRKDRMPVDQDWTAVYPTAAPFRPGSVPLPVRMGFPVKRGVPPEKKGNLELIKIPNFLHLTPTAIKKHCEAMKLFCTEWPSALDTNVKCDEHFPIKIECKDYVSAGTSIRNPSARIVNLRVSICPNYDYAMYLLTVLYHESWKTEAWESEKTVADMEEYSWEDSPSQKNALSTLVRMQIAGEVEGDAVRDKLLGRPEVQEYRESVIRLMNEGESESSILQYREAVKKLLKL